MDEVFKISVFLFMGAVIYFMNHTRKYFEIMEKNISDLEIKIKKFEETKKEKTDV
jgi:hypothetical protein